MDYNKVEDTIMKKAMEYFKDHAIKFFGIEEKIIAPAVTELKNIEIKTNQMDYLFYTEDGGYLHFEFQTTNKKDDLSRFLYYDTSLYCKDKKKVKTVVIYSADIENTETYIDGGSVKYSVEAFYMNSLNGDERFDYLKEKIINGAHLTDEDIVNLTFIPLMKTKEDKNARIMKCIELADKIKIKEDKNKCTTLLYALFDKFGDEVSKKKFMEVISMTEVGKMIFEDGKSEGKAEGKAEVLIKQLIKKFESVPQQYIDKIKVLPELVVEEIATDIFELEKIQDLEKYFTP